jgi:hypothetical protein
LKVCNETCPDYCPYPDECRLGIHYCDGSLSEYVWMKDGIRRKENVETKHILDKNVRKEIER